MSSSYHSPNLNSNPHALATSYHYRPSSGSTNNSAAVMPTLSAHQQPAWEVPQRSVINERQEDLLDAGQQQPRRRFQKRKQMKRSKSVDLYQDPSAYLVPSLPTPINSAHRHPKSISREFLTGARGTERLVSPLSSSSSPSSSSLEGIEHTNQAALLRYKSLDSVTFNHRSSNHTGKENQRRAISKPMEHDFDSDDSVCGIPKPRK